MSRIRQVLAREVIDSRGWPTVEVEMRLDDGGHGRAIVPSGASTGRAEAVELRDGDPARYDGRGVLKAVANVQQILGPAVVGCDAGGQRELDARLVELDGTPDKARLGANALLGVSLAAAHAAAAGRGVPLWRHLNELFAQWHPHQQPRLPRLMTNMISGGRHAGGNLDFQDFLVIARGTDELAIQLEWIARVYRRLGGLLTEAGHSAALVGDEGGYGPPLADERESLRLVVRAIEAAGFEPGTQMTIAVDAAASQFHVGGGYRLRSAGSRLLSSDEMCALLGDLSEAFPIAGLEDPLGEEDWPGWQALTARLGGRLLLVGDDLLATNAARIARAVAAGVANAALIKLNQAGTLSETLEAVAVARQAGYRTIVSARSGETEDTTIADLAVGTASEMIKIGSVARSERLAKYNRLLRIAEELGTPLTAGYVP